MLIKFLLFNDTCLIDYRNNFVILFILLAAAFTTIMILILNIFFLSIQVGTYLFYVAPQNEGLN